MTNTQINRDAEIDLKELFRILWFGKVIILLVLAGSIFLASAYLKDAERLYLVQYKLKPVGETKQNNALSGLGGFASLAGIQLPKNATGDFEIFKELMFSVEVSEIILKNKNLIKKVYAGEWNSSQNIFSEPPKSKFNEYISILKRALTGSKETHYTPPNARRLAIYISGNISVREDKETGFLTISAASSKTDMISSLISEVIETSDQIMRQRYIDFSAEPLAFYKEKIRTSRSREHREALAELISKEEQKLMFASRGKYFIAEPYIDPSITLNPIAPKPKLVLALSLVLGLFFGSVLVLIRHAIKKEN